MASTPEYAIPPLGWYPLPEPHGPIGEKGEEIYAAKNVARQKVPKTNVLEHNRANQLPPICERLWPPGRHPNHPLSSPQTSLPQAPLGLAVLHRPLPV